MYFGGSSDGAGPLAAGPASNYGPAAITQSISITGVDGAGINLTSGDAITINAGINDKINLTNLILDGIGTRITASCSTRAGR